MLLANRTVAESIGKVKKGKKPKTLPYRIHDNPDPQKLETLREFVVKFGYKMKTEGTKGATARKSQQVDVRLRRQTREQSHPDGCTPSHDEGKVLRSQHRTLWTGI